MLTLIIYDSDCQEVLHLDDLETLRTHDIHDAIANTIETVCDTEPEDNSGGDLGIISREILKRVK